MTDQGPVHVYDRKLCARLNAQFQIRTDAAVRDANEIVGVVQAIAGLYAALGLKLPDL